MTLFETVHSLKQPVPHPTRQQAVDQLALWTDELANNGYSTQLLLETPLTYVATKPDHETVFYGIVLREEGKH